MAQKENRNKNSKKVATKLPKAHGSPKVPKYEQQENSLFTSNLIPTKPKKA